jgi:hypothetical protein
MIGRAYDAGRIYGQIAPFIENPSRNGSIQCYNDKNEIVICSSNEICTFDYDQRAVKFRSRVCEKNGSPVVSIYDGGSYSSFGISCDRSLCNDDATFAQIKTILTNNGLTDSNGRRVAAGTKGIASTLLLTLALISVIVSVLI